MKLKRLYCLLLALAVCISLLPGITLRADAATVDYATSSKGYIYNWGTRGETATYLSPMAESFYEDNNITYKVLSALSGSATLNAVPSSALYLELQELDVPGLGRLDHLDQNVAGEQLVLNGMRLAIADLDDLFNRHLDVLNQVAHAVVFNRLNEIVGDFVFIARVGMNDIPQSLLVRHAKPSSTLPDLTAR